MQKDKYRKIPISDNHMHLWKEMPLKDTVVFHTWIMEEFGYETITLNSFFEQLYVPRAKQPNLKIMYLKKLFPNRIYTHAGLRYSGLTQTDNGDYFLEQAKYYNACGYDGIKMLYTTDKYLKGFPYVRLSDSKFDKFFEYMEREELPITIHIGGPEVCYADIEQIPESQRKWHLGDCGIHLFDIFNDFTKMMDKFPDLRIVVAHFGFLTLHFDWAEEWLSKYKNLYFDLTPSLFMYFDFQAKPRESKEFFLKHSDRIIYGTDIGSNTRDEEKKEPAELCHVVRGFFEETEPFEEMSEKFYPIPLPNIILRKFYRENMLNYRKRHAPRIADFERLSHEFELEEACELSLLEKENIEIMKAKFLRKD